MRKEHLWTNLWSHIDNRPADLRKAKNEGIKIIGYFPGNYVPEEIVYASGAIPLCLADGTAPPADAALSVLPNVICPFARAQVGASLLKTNPYYTMIDMLVAPITCQHLRKVAEVVEYFGTVKVFKLGIPQEQEGEMELQYYTDRLRVLKEKLESLTGNSITDEKIKKAITLYNKMRELLEKISLMRRNLSIPITAMEFVKLNHASFYADPVFMVEILDALYKELNKEQQSEKPQKARLLLTGPNMARGDYQILELVEATGGEIVVEEFCEGIRYYWHHINEEGDPMHALASGYLKDRLPCAFLRISTRKRLDFILRLIDDFNVDGVIWYELLCCETYDQESYFFHKELQERNIPMLIVESDYNISQTGPVKTRIDAFMELVRGGLDNA